VLKIPVRLTLASLTALLALVVALSPSQARADIVVIGAQQCDCRNLGADATGNLYAAAPFAHMIYEFGPGGAVLHRFGDGDGLNLTGPGGSAPLPDGNVVLVDQSQVIVVSPQGAYVRTLSSSGAQDVAVDPAGNSYLVGAGGGVRKLGLDGSLIQTWNDPGYGWGAPSGIAYSAFNDHLYVVDISTGKVTELRTDGAMVRVFAGHGSGDGAHSFPYEVETDAQGAVYVSDGTSGEPWTRIKKYSADGILLGSLRDQFKAVYGLARVGDTLYASAFSAGILAIGLKDPIVSLVPGAASLKTSQAQTFDASGSSLPFGSITRYEWDLDGDGTFETDGGSTPTASRRFTTAGTATVGLRVTGSAGQTDSASSVVNVSSSSATFSASANPALTDTEVQFDAGGSRLANSDITNVQWDLDGNGSYETDTGTATLAARTYSSRGTYDVGVRITRSGDVVDAARVPLEVRSKPPSGPVGVSINGGERYTNDPHVTLRLIWPASSVNSLVSNDGGFGTARTVPVSNAVPWTLESSGPERLPKTVYLRFDRSTQTFQDDIILDETPPVVQSATVMPRGGVAATSARARPRRYRLRLKAKDKTSGVAKVQFAARTSRPGKLLKYRRTMTVSGARPKYVRARDRAGNYSRWRRVTVRHA
jgi:PKD domain